MRNLNKNLNISAFMQGTWTPTIQDSSHSDAEGQTYDSQSGNYTRIGSLVLIRGHIDLSSLGTLTTTDNAVIAGLPFTAAASSDSAPASSGTFQFGVTNAGLSIVAGSNPIASVIPGTTYAIMYDWDATSGTTNFLLSNLTVNGIINFTGMYYI